MPLDEQPKGVRKEARRGWESPRVVALPRLVRLTLQTGDSIPGGGDTGGTGSTVVP
jgi:hypothetical protein